MLDVTFNRSSGSVVFAFRILVNGLCMPSSGGGPPALHMPETADDESEEEQEMEETVMGAVQEHTERAVGAGNDESH